MMEKIRCFNTKNPIYQTYHDKEWCVPDNNEKNLFELLILEGAHAGLSWEIILNKRENYRKAFDNFDYNKIAEYKEDKIQELLQNKGIVRNKLKINSAIRNAKVFLEIQKEYESFNNYIWGFVNNKQIKNNWKTPEEIPATSELSDQISKDLKKRGMNFVGSTIIYSYIQAIGIIDDHFVGCHCYKK